MIKKIYAGFFAILVLFVFSHIYASAEEDFSIYTKDIIARRTDESINASLILEVTSIKTELVKGTEIRIPINATHNEGYVAGLIDVKWDNASLELKNVEYSDIAPAYTPAPIANTGKLRLSFGKSTATEDFRETGKFFTLIFIISDSASIGNYEIELFSPDIVNNSLEKVNTSLSNGSIQLIETVSSSSTSLVTTTTSISSSSQPLNEVTTSTLSTTQDTITTSINTTQSTSSSKATTTTTNETKSTNSTSKTTAYSYQTEQTTTTSTDTSPTQNDDLNLGDVNDDGKVDAKDASLILLEYAKMSTGEEGAFNTIKQMRANVNFDNNIDAKDASFILYYYAFASTSTGDIPSMKRFMTSKQE